METKPNPSLQQLLHALSGLYDRKKMLNFYAYYLPIKGDSPDPQPGPFPGPIPLPKQVLIFSNQLMEQEGLERIDLDQLISKIENIGEGDSFMVVFEGIA
jgi:hypothetical protein